VKDFLASRCAIHSGEWKRASQLPTTTSMETIDNGLMTKRVETFVGISEMRSERARLDDPRMEREYVVSPEVRPTESD
jgi:hypothetical protein